MAEQIVEESVEDLRKDALAAVGKMGAIDSETLHSIKFGKGYTGLNAGIQDVLAFYDVGSDLSRELRALELRISRQVERVETEARIGRGGTSPRRPRA